MTERKILKMLVRTLDAYENSDALVSNQGQAMDGYSALANFVYVAQKARELMQSEGIL